jgi:hypothetical protein
MPVKEIRLVTRTRERYTQVRQVLADGASRAEIGRRLGLDPQTVRRFADGTSIDRLLANTRRDTLIDPHTPTSTSAGTTAAPTPPCSTPKSATAASGAACRPCAVTCDHCAQSRAAR